MITLRKSEERGHADHGWLDTHHTFSFANYYDPKHMGFRSLRVINEDRVAPAGGFGTHGHRDMEIISYVLEGSLQHKDSMGTTSVIRSGDIQFMRAGTGIQHSEFNNSSTEPVHFLQIWIVPDERGLEPRYDQRKIDQQQLQSGFSLLASGDGREGSISIHQDVDLQSAVIGPDLRRSWTLRDGRKAWIHVARGAVAMNGVDVAEGDGAAVTESQVLEFVGR
jgi:redox-sensitive bicupin YhaK (pirin superfamily)